MMLERLEKLRAVEHVEHLERMPERLEMLETVEHVEHVERPKVRGYLTCIYKNSMSFMNFVFNSDHQITVISTSLL